MQPQEFYIPTTWRIKGTVERVYDVLSRPREFPRWWPEVYLAVDELRPGDANGVGRVVALRTKGKLPYELNWQAEMTAADKPHGMAVRASGDLEGHGEWRFRQDGDWVVATYDWTVLATKPWMTVLGAAAAARLRVESPLGHAARLRRAAARARAASDCLSKELRERIVFCARAWGVAIERTVATQTSVLVYGKRAAVPVVLKVVKREGDEWRCGEVAAKFGGRGVVQVHEQMAGAALLERLDPGEPLAALTLAGRDDEATDILAMMLGRMAPLDAPDWCPTVERWGEGVRALRCERRQERPARARGAGAAHLRGPRRDAA